MGSIVYRKLFNLELMRNGLTLYLHQKFQKGLEVIKYMKILKSKGD